MRKKWSTLLITLLAALLLCLAAAQAEGHVLVVPRTEDLMLAGDLLQPDTRVFVMTNTSSAAQKKANAWLAERGLPKAVYGLYERQSKYTTAQLEKKWGKSSRGYNELLAQLRVLEPDILQWYCDPAQQELNAYGIALVKRAAASLDDPTCRGTEKVTQWGYQVATFTDLVTGEQEAVTPNAVMEDIHANWGDLITPSIPNLPALNAQGFLDGDAFSYVDEIGGVWFYVSSGLKASITRHTRTSPSLLVWYEAEVWRAEGAEEHLHCYIPEGGGKGHRGGKLSQGKVLSVSSDYHQRRGIRQGGLIIRDGQPVYSYRTGSRKNSSLPNLDTLMLTRDGLLQVDAAGALTTEDALAAGACDVLAFGPMLVKDGRWRQVPTTYHSNREPRMVVASLEENHYLIVFATGRLTNSKGASLDELQQLMLLRGARDAINLDGGATASMYFMGQKIGAVGAYSNHNVTTERSQYEMLTIGTCDTEN